LRSTQGRIALARYLPDTAHWRAIPVSSRDGAQDGLRQKTGLTIW